MTFWSIRGCEVPTITPSSWHPLSISPDAQIFYLTEDWSSSLAEPCTTHHPARMEIFQRQLATAAFKIAGGLELSSALSGPIKQNVISQTFSSKILKAFLDALYALLDGQLRLASDESPAATSKSPSIVGWEDPATVELDLKDGVCHMNACCFGKWKLTS